MHPKSIDLGLARVGAVARRARARSAPLSAVITVGGTNGKGSTVAHLEALLLAAGAAGWHSSPRRTLLRYNERIHVDGARGGAMRSSSRPSSASRRRAARPRLTFFEYNTLAALQLFAERGRRTWRCWRWGSADASMPPTSSTADVAVVCSVGFDHRDWLGDTLEEIGAEKAGIFRSGRPAVLGTAHMPASVYAAIARLGAKPIVAERDFGWRVEAESRGAARWSYRGARLSLADLPPSALAGSIQYRNAATALAALEALAIDGGSAAAAQVAAALDAPTVAAGLRRRAACGPHANRVRAGRVDSGHRAQRAAAEVLAAQLQERPCQGPPRSGVVGQITR